MRISQAGIDLIKGCEGCRLVPYRDSAGVWTDGYGNTHGVVPAGPPIGQAKAEADLRRNLAAAEADVARLARVALTPGQFDALGAAAEFGKWVHAGGEVLPGLVTRRARERALFEGDG